MDHVLGVLAPHLRALVELAAHDGHMTDAAAALGVPQSSMSRRIHALESELGVPLLIHSGRAVRLTRAATDLAQGVRRPLGEIESVVDAVTGRGDPEHGTVRFGFPLTMGSGQVPDLLAEFRRRHPGIRVLLKQAHGSALTADLLSGELELAIVIPPPDRARHTVIGRQMIRAVLPADHRLAAAGGVSLAELAGETFIAAPADYNIRRLTETWCRQAGFTPDIAFEVTEFATIRELISRGLGVSLLPADERTPPGVAEVPLDDAEHSRPIALAWGGSVEAPATRLLSRFLSDAFV
ncbi:LysR family transcriptional regulator [Tomitella gaofuii]|uniref:LysR family transcriptional regulator n=1 Tax=Tomitella gaofuii TaxID=2760083 RepID=UPI0015F9C0A2|nr:LysR family transcriptional regulator [Tomitella gaofuii]